MRAPKIAVRVVGLLLTGALGASGFANLIDGFRFVPDPVVGCAPGASGRCFTREQAVVSSENGPFRVAYADGTKSTHLRLRGDVRPREETRLRLERWNGAIVSLYDPVREVRYRTHDWPVRWSGHTFVLPFVVVLILAALFAVQLRGLWRLVRR